MAYLKPPWFSTHVFNPLAKRFGIGGSEELVVRGRTTGQPQSIPVIPVVVDGAAYVVAARGETEWVRNARAAGEVELKGGTTAGRYRVAEVPAAERGPIVEAYRAKAGRTVEAYWKQLPDDADHPVFALTAV